MRSKLPILFAVFALVLGACSSTPAATTAPTAAPAATAAPATAAPATAAPAAGGGSVSFTRFAEAAPVFTTTQAQSNQYMLYYLVFDTLVALDLSDKTLQTLKPRMAESWEISPDAKTFTFKLRKDIKWHDGKPFTADDVVWTATWTAENRSAFIGFPPAWFSVKDQGVIEKACTDAGGTDATKCGGTTEFAGVKKIDDYTVQFNLETPDVFFLRSMADAPSVILPKHLLVGQTRDQITKNDFTNKNPVGTGPFKLKEIAPDQFISFSANPDYYGGKPKLDTVFYKAIKAETALAQIESGELDAIFNAGASNLDRLSKVDILDVQANQAPGIFALTLQTDTDAQRTEWNKKFKYNLPPVNFNLSDKRVRQAINYAIDRRSINDQLFGGRNKILWNPPGFKSYDDLNQYLFDPAKAKELLAAAVKDGAVDLTKTLRFTYATDLADSGKIVPIMKQQLEAVGFKVELTALDIDTYNTLTTGAAEEGRGKYDLITGAGGSEGLSPSRSQIYFKCSGTALGITFDEPPTNGSGYYNCALRELFLKARTQADPAAQDETYHQAAKILNEDLSTVYLWQLAGVHPRQQAGPGPGRCQLRAVHHHRRRQLVRHQVAAELSL